MGAWSAGITGNDTSSDLKMEYKVAFSRFSPEEAVEKLDMYARIEFGANEDDVITSIRLPILCGIKGS